jgi:hypothetical protein
MLYLFRSDFSKVFKPPAYGDHGTSRSMPPLRKATTRLFAFGFFSVSFVRDSLTSVVA